MSSTLGIDQTTGANAQSTALSKIGARSRQLWEQCCGFEELFLNLLLKEMSATVDHAGGAVPESAGSRVVRSMFSERLAEAVGRSGRIGLAATLYRGFERTAGVIGLDEVRQLGERLDRAA